MVRFPPLPLNAHSSLLFLPEHYFPIVSHSFLIISFPFLPPALPHGTRRREDTDTERRAYGKQIHIVYILTSLRSSLFVYVSERCEL